MVKIKEIANKLSTKAILIAVYIMNIFDLIVTTVWVNSFGLNIEANPIAKMMYSNNSIYAFKSVGILALLFVLYKALKKTDKWNWTIWVLFGVYSALTLYHLFIIAKVAIIYCGVLL